MLLATALLIVGLLLVVYSADRLVFAASILCRTFGIPPLIIGMTVVSIGTSLPEIIVSLAASLHEQRDLAVGTALGSNIINILLILGLAAEGNIIQHAAVRPLDGGGLVVGVTLHGVELDGVALVIGDSGLTAVLDIVVHIALKVGRVSQRLPQLDLVGFLVVGGDVQHLGQKLVVQVGVGAGVPSWGHSLATSVRFISIHPLAVVWPGLVVTLVVIALNLFGDALRDAIDPLVNPALREVA